MFSLLDVYYSMLHRAIPCCSRTTFLLPSRLKSASATVVEPDDQFELKRTAVDGVMHVTSLNIQTQKKRLMELSVPEEIPSSSRVRKCLSLPSDAINGLRNAIVECSRPPKQLQHEADQLSLRLSQRRFPASPSVVRDMRNKIKRSLRSKQSDEDLGGDDLLNEKMREAREYQLKNEVDKQLKKTNYNWKPLEMENMEAAAAYALARLVPNFAEVSRALDEFGRVPDFQPTSILDYGCGVGGAFWAANQRFGSCVKEYCLVDTNDFMTKMAMDIMRSPSSPSPSLSSRVLVHPNVSFRRHIVPSPQITYDLVICHRTLIEIGSHETRQEMLTQLWRRTNKYLVLIEDAKDDSFNALLEARDFLLTAGNEIHLEETFNLLKQHNVMDEYAEKLLNDQTLSDYERWQMVREKLPPGIEPPTNLPSATVFAPCPHDMGCPLAGGKSSCNVPIRWENVRADGKRTKRESDGTEIGKMSYVIMEKGERRRGEEMTRILKSRKLSGHSTCDVCTAFCGLQRFTVSKRGGELYRLMKSKRDGQLLPINMKTIATEDMFNVYGKVKSGRD